MIINRLLDGFEGKLTSTKWAKLAKCSRDTAHRDIPDLIQRGVLAKDAAGGRSAKYHLSDPKKLGLDQHSVTQVFSTPRYAEFGAVGAVWITGPLIRLVA
ncbi:MAG: hypothetical protein NVV74_10560 [Magnetospirillum sp.]|nr:hypothetical protein [Magnetospirillum sp.]